MAAWDRITAASDVVARTVKEAWASARETPTSDEQLHARAGIESVRVSENYRYSQEISRNAYTRALEAPTGEIEIHVPYDGSRYFTRQALSDVKHGLSRGIAGVTRDALIGHLLLANHGHTNLRQVAGLRERNGSLPVTVPIDDGDLEQLVADERSCEMKVNYSPSEDWPRVLPLEVLLDLLDPDNLELSYTDLQKTPAKLVADQISQQVGFERYLMLVVRVRLLLPRESGLTSADPLVRRCSVKWPTITSLRALTLKVGLVDTPFTDHDEVPFTYNADSRSLEWENVAMDTPTEEGDELVYESARMSLLIRQPEALYQGQPLTGVVEVEIPGQLLSGVECRVHDATGAIDPGAEVEMTTTLSTSFELILDDAFAKRLLFPMQHLHFDEVIPETMRVADIESALKDRGFTIVKAELPLEGVYDLRYLVRAEKKEGPYTMQILLVVQGRRYETKRQTQGDGGLIFTRKLESGEMTVYMLGRLPRDSREVTHEMNVLQRALRERFHRVQARR